MFTRIAVLAALVLLAVGLPSVCVYAQADLAASSLSTQILGFEENRGQWLDSEGRVNNEILYRAQMGNSEMLLYKDGITFVYTQYDNQAVYDSLAAYPDTDPDSNGISPIDTFRFQVTNRFLHLRFVGSNADAAIQASAPLAVKKDYFLAHTANGIRDVSTYERVLYQGIYPGVDWVVYFDRESGRVKHEFHVAPGTDPDIIRYYFVGANAVSSTGEVLRVASDAGSFSDEGLHVYQPKRFGATETVPATFSVTGDTVSYDIPHYDSTRTLVIDPYLSWLTLYGGSGMEFPKDICVTPSNEMAILSQSPNTQLGYYPSNIESYLTIGQILPTGWASIFTSFAADRSIQRILIFYSNASNYSSSTPYTLQTKIMAVDNINQRIYFIMNAWGSGSHPQYVNFPNGITYSIGEGILLLCWVDYSGANFNNRVLANIIPPLTVFSDDPLDTSPHICKYHSANGMRVANDKLYIQCIYRLAEGDNARFLEIDLATGVERISKPLGVIIPNGTAESYLGLYSWTFTESTTWLWGITTAQLSFQSPSTSMITPFTPLMGTFSTSSPINLNGWIPSYIICYDFESMFDALSTGITIKYYTYVDKVFRLCRIESVGQRLFMISHLNDIDNRITVDRFEETHPSVFPHCASNPQSVHQIGGTGVNSPYYSHLFVFDYNFSMNVNLQPNDPYALNPVISAYICHNNPGGGKDYFYSTNIYPISDDRFYFVALTSASGGTGTFDYNTTLSAANHIVLARQYKDNSVACFGYVDASNLSDVKYSFTHLPWVFHNLNSGGSGDAGLVIDGPAPMAYNPNLETLNFVIGTSRACDIILGQPFIRPNQGNAFFDTQLDQTTQTDLLIGMFSKNIIYGTPSGCYPCTEDAGQNLPACEDFGTGFNEDSPCGTPSVPDNLCPTCPTPLPD